MEPSAERVVGSQPHCLGLSGEDEEDGLEGVVGRVPVARHPAADAQHHRPVAIHQGGERRLGRGDAPAPREPCQQLGVGEAPRSLRPRRGAAQSSRPAFEYATVTAELLLPVPGLLTL